MTGIVSCSAYIPYYRLNYEEFARAWNKKLPKGERAVANYDEDCITMAVEAAMGSLNGVKRESINGVYSASTTAPYKEKQSAALIGEALDLGCGISSMDFANSLRSGTNALLAAVNAIQARPDERILVTAADCRLAMPQSSLEYTFGDGAAALILGSSDLVAEVEYTYSTSDEMLDWWRTDTDLFVNTWEDRFVLQQGYMSIVPKAVSEFIQKFGVTLGDFNRVAYYAPDPRSHASLARVLKLSMEDQVQPCLIGKIGNTGCSNALAHLIAALEEANDGDRLLFISYGDGCDVLSLRVTAKVANLKHPNHRTIKSSVERSKKLSSYEKYLAYRNLLSVDISRRASYPSSASVVRRERDQIIRYHGFKCRNCGTIQLPRPDNIRVCVACQSEDQMEHIRLSEMTGKITSFAQDFVFATIDPPAVQVVVNFEGGGRVLGYLTDVDFEKLGVGAPVRMTFRKISDSAGFHNYYWKAKLI